MDDQLSLAPAVPHDDLVERVPLASYYFIGVDGGLDTANLRP